MKSRSSAIVLVVCLLVLRSYLRLQQPEIWAEDGAYFLQGALEYGWKSLGILEAGYYLFYQRLSACLAVSLFPPEAWPRFFMGVYYLVYALIASKFISGAYDWFLPRGVFRLGVIASLALLPGLNEMVGSACNLPWLYCFYLLSLGLKSPDLPLKRHEILIGIGCAFSCGGAVFTLPAFLARAWIRHSRKLSFKREGLLAATLFSLAIWLRLAMPPQWHEQKQIAVLDWLKVMSRSTARSGLVQPWLGDPLATHFSDTGWNDLFGTLSILGLLALGFHIIRKKGQDPISHLTLALTPVLFWPVLAMLTRFHVGEVWTNSPNVGFFKHRYSFPVAWVAVLFWFGWMECKALKRVRIYQTWLLVALVLSASTRFWILPYGEKVLWPTNAKAIREAEASNTASLVLPIYPEGWSFRWLKSQTDIKHD